MAEQKARLYEVKESIVWSGQRLPQGENLIPFGAVVSLEMMKGKSKADAMRVAESLPTSKDGKKEQKSVSEKPKAKDEVKVEKQQKEPEQEEEAEQEAEPVEGDFDEMPHSVYFKRAGYDTLAKVQSLEDLTDVDGISDNRAEEVKEFLTNLSDSEG